MRLITWGAVLSCALACVSAPAATRTHEYMLDNGLKLLVQEDHRAHVAVVQEWYRVGSS